MKILQFVIVALILLISGGAYGGVSDPLIDGKIGGYIQVFNAASYHASNRTDVELQAAADDATVSGGVVLVDAAYTLGAGVTIPSDVTLKFDGLGHITLGAHDLDINGPIESPMQVIFDQTSSGIVMFNEGSDGYYVDKLYAVWWGAIAYESWGVADGNGDMAQYIQAAVDSAELSSVGIHGGITVQLTGGVYYLSSTITIDNNYIALRGDPGGDTTFWRTDKNYGTTLELDNADYVTVSDLFIRYINAVDPCVDTHLDLIGVEYSLFENIRLDSGYRNLRVGGGYRNSFNNIQVQIFNSGSYSNDDVKSAFEIVYDAAGDDHQLPGSMFFTDCYFADSSDPSIYKAEYGLYVDAVDGLWWENGHIGTAETGIYLLATGRVGVTDYLKSVYFSNLYVDNIVDSGPVTTTAVRFAESGVAEDFSDIGFINSFFRRTTDGPMVVIGGSPSGVTFTGCRFFSGDRQAIDIGATAHGVAIVGNIFGGNNQDNTASVCDIQIESGAASVAITGNTFSTTGDASGAGNSKGGVYVVTSATTADVTIAGNSFGNLPAGVLNWSNLTGPGNYAEDTDGTDMTVLHTGDINFNPTGNIGKNELTPFRDLHITKTATGAGIRVERDDGSPSYVDMYNGSNKWITDYTGSSGFEWQASTSAIMNLAAAGNLTIVGDLAVNGDDITSDGTMTIDAVTDIVLDADGGNLYAKDGGTEFLHMTATTTNLASRVLKINDNRTASAAYLDIRVDGQADFGLRMLRNTGANGTAYIQQVGTGSFALKTNGANTLVMDSGNDVSIPGDLDVTGKITGTGGVDPPYVLYDRETRTAIAQRVEREVVEGKLDGMVMFYNGDTDQMELFLPSKGEFRLMATNAILEIVDPVEPFPVVEEYYLDNNTGEVRTRQRHKARNKHMLNDGYIVDAATGKFLREDTGEEVIKEIAVEIKTHEKITPTSKLKKGLTS